MITETNFNKHNSKIRSLSTKSLVRHESNKSINHESIDSESSESWQEIDDDDVFDNIKHKDTDSKKRESVVKLMKKESEV